MREGLRRVRAKVAGFGANHEGQVALTFALAFIPALTMVGAAVDYGRLVTLRSNLQQATDATVLAIARNALASSSTVDTLKVPTQTYLGGTMAGATLTSLTLQSGNSGLCIVTSSSLPTTIMAIANIPKMTATATACAQPASGKTVEVALALDNASSMADSAGATSKLAALQTAAQQLVNTLNPSGTASPTAAISIVPFTALVNVGTSKTAPFLDTQGKSSIHWQNFHRPSPILFLAPFYPTSKFDLFSALTNASWAGCVEERPAPFTTTDTAAVTGTPDTLFVPFLSPDDPGDTNQSDCLFVNPVTQVVSTSCAFGTKGPNLLDTHQFANSYLQDTGAVNVVLPCLLNPLSVTDDTIQLPLLASDNQQNYFPGGGETMVCKYNNGTVVPHTTGIGLTTGPNYLCSGTPVTPLTTDRSALTSAINAMQAGGGGNLAAGLMWGWRTISPTVAPFPVASPSTIGPQNPKSYAVSGSSTTAANRKFLILMTDGYNAWTPNPYSPWGSDYEAFGYYVNNRIASYGSCSGSGTVATTSTTARCQLDNVTLEACMHAKTAGVTIYTVGLSSSGDPIDAQGISLLQSCASTSANYFQASDGSGVVAAFQQIAANIQGLRLTQ